MRLHRLIAILLLLESRGQLKARELAAALETSERTIHRDIATLCEAGIPIEAVAGPTGGFRLLEGYTNHLPQLPHHEAISLFLRGMGLNPLEEQEAHADLQRALGRLEARLPARYRQDVRAAQKRFYFDPTPWWEGVPLSFSLDVLRQAVWHARKVSIQYENSVHEKTARVVRPYGLVVKAMHWYLVAFCETRQAIRTFSIARIEEAMLLEETFEWPSDFSLETYWNARTRTFTTEVVERERDLWS
ncbi:MAG: helix-turn-helix transcriptional regulator [Armatimonadota bacterium]